MMFFSVLQDNVAFFYYNQILNYAENRTSEVSEASNAQENRMCEKF